jgi:hypothetical protein
MTRKINTGLAVDTHEEEEEEEGEMVGRIMTAMVKVEEMITMVGEDVNVNVEGSNAGRTDAEGVEGAQRIPPVTLDPQMIIARDVAATVLAQVSMLGW